MLTLEEKALMEENLCEVCFFGQPELDVLDTVKVILT